MEEKAKKPLSEKLAPLFEKLSKMGKWFYAFVAAAVLLVGAIIAIIVVAINGREEPIVIPPDGPETGVYYYDAANGEYTISFNSGNKFAISGPDLNKSGEYTVNGATVTFDFVRDEDGTTTATIADDKLAFVWNGATMNFTKKVPYTISFNTNGGNNVDTITVINGKTASQPADPTKDGNVFLGWFADEALTKAFAFATTPIKANTTVYAKWAERTAGQNEYNIDFVLGCDGTAPADIATIGGKLYFGADYTEPTRDGYTFAGWFVSMYEDGEKLTYQATEGTAFDANTTLFAVWTDNAAALKAPIVNVTDKLISWNNVPGATGYSISIADANGNVLVSASEGSTMYTIDFNSYEAGDYTITVVAKGSGNNSTPTVRSFKNKALGRVSQFEVINNTLVFNPVANAEKYLITVDCGNKKHEHTLYDNGKSTVFNFQNCDMQVGGIKFTVTAVATGYASTTSETYVIDRTLEAVNNIAYDAATATFNWVSVPGATGYDIVILVDGKHYANVKGYAGNSYCIKELSGNVTFAVLPVSAGYNSPISSTITEISRLVPATPTNVTVNGMKVTWDEVPGATSYTVYINGSSVPSVATNEFDFATYAGPLTTGAKYSISVMAVNTEKSIPSDPIVASYITMGNVYYSENIVSWDPVIGVNKFEVKINNADTIIVEGQNYAEIYLTQSGINTIGVRPSSFASNADFTNVSVFAYTVIYDSRSLNNGILYEYVAKGDKLTLPTRLELAGYTFDGWYSTPGAATSNGAAYTNTSFLENNDIILYANWAPKSYKLTANGIGDTISGVANEQIFEVVYTKDFKIPVPTTTDLVNSNFAGWYTGPDGTGTRLTDYLGNSVAPYGVTTDNVMYPYFISGIIFELKNDDTYSVRKGDNVDLIPVITIPETYNGLPVSSILENGFYNCDRLIEINIPDTIKLIGASAFASCDALVNINVYDADPGNVHEVFYSSYNGALIYDDVASGSTYLEVFPRAKKGEFTVPAGVDIIRNRAFNYAKISSLVISNEVKSIGDYAFSNCRSLVKVTFEEGGTAPVAISPNAFYGCYAVTTIQLPVLLKGPGENDEFSLATLDYLTALQSIEIPATAGSTFSTVSGMLCDAMGETILYCPKAYSGISGVLTIPNGITAIGDSTFAGRNVFTEIIIPNFVTVIGEKAFANCRNVKAVTFNGNRMRDLEIGSNAFYGCSNVREIIINGCDTGIETGVITIGSSAFSGQSELRTLTIANGVNINTIGSYAFAGNLKLRNINIADNAIVGVIGNAAFYGCEGLITFTIPASTTSIGNSAFENCKILKSVAFAPNGQSIEFGKYVFKDCVSLSSIELPATVKSFDGSGFDGCYAIKEIIVDPSNPYLVTENGILYDKNKTEIMFYPKAINDPDLSELPWNTLTKIGNTVFKDNSTITSVTIPANITSIGEGAFNGCVNLSTVTVLNGGTNLTIGDYAFANCQNLSTVDFPAYTSSIGAGAFYMTPLTSFTVPSDVTVIGNLAFAYTSLTSINIPSKVALIGDGAFKGSKLANITIDQGDGSVPLVIGQVEQINIDYRFDSLDYNQYTLSKIFPIHYIGIDAEGVFYGTSVKDINLPARVTAIGSLAFYNVTTLNSITIDENSNLAAIGDGAFYGSSIKSIQLENTKLKTVGEFAFASSALNSVSLPSTITLIDKYSFADIGKISGTKLYPSLASVTIANGGTEALTIANFAFQNSCFTTIDLPKNLTVCAEKELEGSHDPQYGQYIKAFYRIFEGNAKLSEVNVDENCVLYGSKDGIFYEKDENGKLTSLLFCPPAKKGEVIIPNTVTYVEHRAFYKSSLTTITFEEFPDNHENYAQPILEIGSADSSQSALVSFTVFGGNKQTSGTRCAQNKVYSYYPDLKLKSITNNDYIQHSAIKEINFPSHIKSVASYAISGIEPTGLNINFNQNSGEVEFCQKAIYNNKGLITLALPKVSSVGTSNWYDSTFGNNTNMTNVTFAPGSTVTALTHSVFSGCSSLKSIEIPASVTYIGESCFANCKALTEVTFATGSQIASIDHTAFSACAFEEFTIPDSVTYIGRSVFQSCSNLTKVHIGNGLKSVSANDANGNPSSAFYGNTSIEEFTIANNHPTLVVEDGVIYDLAKSIIMAYPAGKDPTGYTIPSTVKEIADYAFYAFPGQTIVLPNNLTTIGYGAFYASKITSINIPATVTVIEGYAFAQSSTSYACLTTVTFDAQSQLTTIGKNAFMYGKFETINLPDNITTIGNSAFATCQYLKSIILPEKLEAIPQSAFSGCSRLESVTIGNRVSSIGVQAFTNAKKLQSVYIPESVNTIGFQAFYANSAMKTLTFAENSRLTKIDYQAFQDCTSLVEVVIPAGVSELGLQVFKGCSKLKLIDMSQTAYTALTSSLSSGKYYGFFYGCKALETVILPETLEIIDENCFEGCSSLKAIHIPASVTTIGNGAFDGCASLESVTFGANSALTSLGSNPKATSAIFRGTTSLKSIVLPESIETIGGSIFENSGLESISLPDKLSTISAQAFKGCANLTEVNVPATVTDIHDEAFMDCSSLSKVTLAEGIEYLGSDAFGNCTLIEKIEIPASVLRMGGNPFSNCLGIQEFKLNPANESFIIDGTGVLYDVNMRTVIFYPASATSETYEMPNTVFELASSAFAGSKLKSITISDNIKVIPLNAFKNSKLLESVTIPLSVTTIADEAFYGCSKLDNVVIPASCTSIGNAAFAYCTSLKAFDFGIRNAELSIGHSLFKGCSSFSNIIISENITKIPDYMFEGTGVVDLVIPDSVTDLSGTGIFRNCKKLETVQFSENARGMLGVEAFAGCSALKEIELPEGINTIGKDWGDSSAFKDCTSLKKVTLGEIYYINDSTFSGCTSLETVELDASSIEFIGYYAFENCTSLTKLDLSASGYMEIYDYAFYGCSALTELLMPEGYLDWLYDGMFEGCSSLMEINFPCLGYADCPAFIGWTSQQSIYFGDWDYEGLIEFVENGVFSECEAKVYDCDGNQIIYDGDACEVIDVLDPDGNSIYE